MSSLDHLIKKLAGASPSVTETSENTPIEEVVEKTNPVYVEKLASAIDFIVDSLSIEEPATEKVAAREPVAVEDTSVSHSQCNAAIIIRKALIAKTSVVIAEGTHSPCGLSVRGWTSLQNLCTTAGKAYCSVMRPQVSHPAGIPLWRLRSLQANFDGQLRTLRARIQ